MRHKSLFLAWHVFSVALLAGTGGCSRHDAAEPTSVAGTSTIDTDTAADARAAMQAYAERGAYARNAETASPAQSSGASGNEGTMAGGAPATVDDATLAARVRAALAADSDLKNSGIQVEAEKGEVTLTGVLSNQTQIDRAVKLTRGIDGITDIRSRLSIRR